MDYGQIINRSFEIAWKYKWLWVFGMFGSGSFNADFNVLAGDASDTYTYGDFSFDPTIILSFLAVLAIWVMIMIICQIISDSALIDSVNRIERGGQYSFGIAFSTGLNYFLRLLGLNIVMFFITAVIMTALIIFAVIFFAIDTAVGFLSLLFIIPLFFIALFITITIWQLSKRVLVVRDASIADSISEGYYLLKNYFGKNLILFLINIGFSIVFGIAIMIIFFMAGVPMALVLSALNLSTIYAFFGAFLFGLPISLVFGGFFGTFSSSLYTIFYFRLVEPPQDTQFQLQNEPPPATTV